MSAAPDYAEPFVAWRVWRVLRGGSGLRLGSVVKPTVWPPGAALTAECLHALPLLRRLRGRPAHDAPAERCECGIYAAELDRIGQYLSDPVVPRAVGRVLGEVSLWGEVIECERGFRASQAYPLRIYVPADACRRAGLHADEVADTLSDAYGVDAEAMRVRCVDAPRALALSRLVVHE